MNFEMLVYLPNVQAVNEEVVPSTPFCSSHICLKYLSSFFDQSFTTTVVLYSIQVLPPVFKNKIPNNCNSIQLRDAQDRTFNVGIRHEGENCLYLTGAGWNEFQISHMVDDFISTLCFKFIAERQFNVTVFNVNGLEIIRRIGRPPYVRSCLIVATADTCIQQDVPPSLLAQLTARRYAFDHNTVKIESNKQDGRVNVVYRNVVPGNLGTACGFTGPPWTTICFENNIEPGDLLLFTNKGFSTRDRQIYGLTVFSDNGIGLHLMSNEACNHIDHQHNNDHPFYLKNIPYHTLANDLMSVPTSFVRATGLNSFRGVELIFGHLSFGAIVRIKHDNRVDGEQTHVCLWMDWKGFLEDTGLTEDKVLRFTFRADRSIPGDLAYIEVC